MPIKRQPVMVLVHHGKLQFGDVGWAEPYEENNLILFSHPTNGKYLRDYSSSIPNEKVAVLERDSPGIEAIKERLKEFTDHVEGIIDTGYPPIPPDAKKELDSLLAEGKKEDFPRKYWEFVAAAQAAR